MLVLIIHNTIIIIIIIIIIITFSRVLLFKLPFSIILSISSQALKSSYCKHICINTFVSKEKWINNWDTIIFIFNTIPQIKLFSFSLTSPGIFLFRRNQLYPTLWVVLNRSLVLVVVVSVGMGVMMMFDQILYQKQHL